MCRLGIGICRSSTGQGAYVRVHRCVCVHGNVHCAERGLHACASVQGSSRQRDTAAWVAISTHVLCAHGEMLCCDLQGMPAVTSC